MLYQQGPWPACQTMATFLHVGCGHKRKNSTTRTFDDPQWQEVRLDIDPRTQPDVVSSITHMHEVSSQSMDAIFSSHNLEHLHAHEIPAALKEFVRVLTPDGFMVLTCPDLQAIAALIAEDKLMQVAYHSAAGPITPLDMVYGLQKALAKGDMHMAHRCGFTQKVLVATLKACGFAAVASLRRPQAYDLWALASKSPRTAEQVKALALAHFPLEKTASDTTRAVPADAS